MIRQECKHYAIRASSCRASGPLPSCKTGLNSLAMLACMVVVFGATGSVGKHVVQLLRQKGLPVRQISRQATSAGNAAQITADLRTPDTLKPALAGATGIISCAGGSVSIHRPGQTSFLESDAEGHANLAEAVRQGQAEGRCNVQRIVYCSAYAADTAAYAATTYIQAHRQAEANLQATGIGCHVVRPTGIFSALSELVDFARKGYCPVIGNGLAKSNPIHPRDVAEAIVQELFSAAQDTATLRIRDVGGPDLLTRREMAEAAFRAVKRKPRIFSTPPAVMRGLGSCLGPFRPRTAELLRFYAAVSVEDCIAPVAGKRSLADYLEAYAELAVAAQAAPPKLN